MEACKAYGGRQITFEYVLLQGVNDSAAEGRQLGQLLKSLPAAHVNLIPFNPWDGSAFKSSPRDVIRRFEEAVNSKGISTSVRWPKGRDIMAACGQLAAA